jgi:mycothiol synthase
MALHLRKFDPNGDDSRIRQFLRDVFLCNDRHAVSWPLYRWDYWRWHLNLNIHQFNLEAAIFLWETGCGNLAAFLNPCHPGEACLQVHPEFDTPELAVEMMTTAETQFATHLPEGGQKLTIWCPSADRQRQDILTRRGYTRSDRVEIHYRRKLAKPIQAISPPTGYILRSLHNDEVPARSWLEWKTTHPHESETRYPGWEWYFNVQRAPLYDRNLDLVAEAPTGELTAFCTVWIDEPTHTAAFEPVGAHPAHRHSDLVQALLSQGLQCALSRGATLGIITACDEASAESYAAAGFTPSNLSQAWVKNWA